MLLQVRCTAQDTGRDRALVDPKLEYQEQVEGHECNQGAGNHKHVEREEAGQRRSGNDRASEQKAHQLRSDKGDPTDDRRSNAEPPIGILIKSQNLTGEGHPERHQEKKDSHDPGELPRVLVSAEEEHLHHVNHDNGEHEVRAPPMEGSNEPASRDLVIQRLQAAPSLTRGGYINDGQKNAGAELEQEHRQGAASEDIKPAGGPSRYGMRHGFLDWPGELQTLLEPVADSLNHAHDELPHEAAHRDLP